MEIQGIHIGLLLGGVIIGMIIILLVLKVVASILSVFGGGAWGGHRPYDSERERSSGCLFPVIFVLIIIIAAFVFGAKALRESELFTTNIGDRTRPEQTLPSPTPPEQIPVPIKYDDDEIPFVASGAESAPSGVSQLHDDEQTRKGGAMEPEPYNAHLLQTDFYFDYDNAARRMAELAAYGLSAGIYLKEKNGRTGYAVYIGPFNNRSEALEVQAAHGLRGHIMPCHGLDLLRYEGH